MVHDSNEASNINFCEQFKIQFYDFHPVLFTRNIAKICNVYLFERRKTPAVIDGKGVGGRRTL